MSLNALFQANQFPAATTVVDPVFYNAVQSLLTAVNATGAGVATGTGPSVLQTSPTLITPQLGVAQATSVNYIAVENGANNAIACAAASGPPLATGLIVTVLLAHTLQAGANTFAYLGGATAAIKLNTNPATDIATAYAVGGVIILFYNGTVWMELS